MLSMFSLKYFLFIQEELSALGHQSLQHSKNGKLHSVQWNIVISVSRPNGHILENLSVLSLYG